MGKNITTPNAKRVDGTDTFRPIRYEDIPAERRGDVTYTRVVCEVRPQKEEQNQTRITIGGNNFSNTPTDTRFLDLCRRQYSFT